MIFYFSATGNSKHVATQIAQKTGDKLTNIADCIRNDQFDFVVSANENVGIISPTYDWKLPVIVDEFLSKLAINVKKDAYIFFIATYGTFCGQTGRFANEIMKIRGYSIDAFFSVKMPDTWTPLFNLSDKAKTDQINRNADTEIEQIISSITKRLRGDYMRNKTPLFLALFQGMQYESVRKTNHFKVEDSCIGCGSCAKNCPADAIRIENGKPVWVKDKCVMCLGCLHRCPKFAIQYGNLTQKHGQYTHPGYK